MIKRPLIIGSRGNMASRYQAIFKYLEIDTVGVDQGDDWPEMGFDGILIATPTATHVEVVRRAADYRLPILVEKPISRDMAEVDHLIGFCKAHNVRLMMVDQYNFLTRPTTGTTLYNYFKHGSDGIFHDCTNIIAHATGDVMIGEFSPIWRCTINGAVLDVADMDRAYIDMIRNWVRNPRADLDYIAKAHRKVLEFEKNATFGRHRDTGPFWIYSFTKKSI